jgi:CRP-like cAMP-binding protein
MTEMPRTEQSTIWKPTLLGSAWYASCPEDLQDALLQHGRLHNATAGSTVFELGATDHALYCVLSGQVQAYYPDPSGAMSMLITLQTSHWFGEMSFIDAEPRSHTAVAEQHALLLCVDRVALQPFLAQHPGCWHDIARLAVSKLRRVSQLNPVDAQLPARTRLLKQLWLVAHSHGLQDDAPQTRLQLSQDQLASALGITRQTANKVLRDLELQGLVKRHYGEVELLNLPGWQQAMLVD